MDSTSPSLDEPLVLIAEDDDDIRVLVRHRLQQAGLRVVAARSGADAISLASEHRPDVLLLDIGLPDLSGFEVCRVVLAESERPPAVIFLTARDATADRVSGLEAGAVDYIAKPFEAAELLARVHAALRTKRLVDDLSRRAVTDPLTGLLNRDSLAQRASEQIALARRGRPLAAVMCDVDHFKQLNDEHGHAAGDEVLREVARRIRVAVRASDLVFRYGGEEFLVLLPDTDVAGAETAGAKLLSTVGATPVELEPAALRVGISVGVAGWKSEMTRAEDLFVAADAALYEAKRLGRGRVSVA